VHDCVPASAAAVVHRGGGKFAPRLHPTSRPPGTTATACVCVLAGAVYQIKGDYTAFVGLKRRVAPLVSGTQGIVVGLAAGEQFGMAVNDQGVVYSWGAGTNGQVRMRLGVFPSRHCPNPSPATTLHPLPLPPPSTSPLSTAPRPLPLRSGPEPRCLRVRGREGASTTSSPPPLPHPSPTPTLTPTPTPTPTPSPPPLPQLCRAFGQDTRRSAADINTPRVRYSRACGNEDYSMLLSTGAAGGGAGAGGASGLPRDKEAPCCCPPVEESP
jgi:hypothetical protein